MVLGATKRASLVHPRLPMRITVTHAGKMFRGDVRSSVANFSAQVTIMPMEAFEALRLPKKILTPSKLEIRAANGLKIETEGHFTGDVSARSTDGSTVDTAERIYITKGVNDFYWSCDAMIGLGILGKDFPMPVPKNGHGNHASHWSRTGIVMEALYHAA